MLKYGEAYLEQNEIALQKLSEPMSEAAKAVALEMAPDLDDEIAFDEDELEAA